MTDIQTGDTPQAVASQAATPQPVAPDPAPPIADEAQAPAPKARPTKGETSLSRLIDDACDDPITFARLLNKLMAEEDKAAAAATSASDWLAQAPQADRDYARTKGWKSSADLLQSYRNVERLVGERLPMPRDADDLAGLERIYKALGRPDAPEGYKLPVAEGGDTAFAAEAARWFHGAGLSPRQATALAEQWNAYMRARQDAGGDAPAHDEAAGLAPEAARQRIDALKADKEWQARFFDGDADEVTRWTRLHEVAHARA